MKIYGDLNFDNVGSLVESGIAIESPDTLPTSGVSPGRLSFVNGQLFICTVVTSGVPTWVELTDEVNAFLFTQASASTTWNITHNLNSESPVVQLYDSSGNQLIPNAVTINNANTLTVTFTSAQSGTAIVMAGPASGNSGGGGGGGGSTAISSLTGAGATNTINNSNYGQIWNWALTSASAVGLTLSENTASTGGSGSQYLFEVITRSGSTANPFGVLAGGNNSLTINTSGAWLLGSSLVSGSSGQVLISNGSSQAPSWLTLSAGTGISYSSGTISNTGVTSVALSDGSTTPIYTISGSPVTTTGTLTFSLNTQSANKVFAGPSSGSAAQPSFRSLVVADLPTSIPNANLANSSVTVTAGTGLSGGGSVSLGSSITLTNAGVTSLATAGTYAGALTLSGSTGAVTITPNLFSTATTTAGVVPGSNGSTTNFLRGDGTWAAAAGSPSTTGGTGAVQYNNAGVFGSSSSFIFQIASSIATLFLGNSASVSSSNLTPQTVSSGTGLGFLISGGATNDATASGGKLTLAGGSSTSTTGQGGNLVFQNGATSTGGTGGLIQFQLCNPVTPVTQFTINQSGALGLGSGVSYGSSGQVLTSAGSGGPPTWTTVSGGSGVSSLTGTANEIAVSASTGAVTLSMPVNVVIPTPSSGIAFSTTGVSGQNVAVITSGSSATTTVADFKVTRAGSTSNNVGQGPSISMFDSTNNNNTIIQNSGGQTEIWQNNSGTWNQLAFWNSSRAATFNAPSTGAAATVNGVSGSNTLVVASGGAATTASADLVVTRAGSTGNAEFEGPNVAMHDTTNGGATILQNSGGQTELWQSQSTSSGIWHQILFVNSNWGVVVNAPSSGVGLTVSGPASGTALNISTGAVQLAGSAGTSGQVLTSAGAGATPTWQTPNGLSGSGTATLSVSSIAVGQAAFVWASATASKTSTSGTAIDTVLQMTSLPVGWYTFESYTKIDASTGYGGGVEYGFSNSSGTVTNSNISANYTSSVSTTSATGADSAFATLTNTISTTTPGDVYSVWQRGSFQVTAAATIGLYWGPTVSSADALSRLSGSYFSITRIN